MMPQMQKTKERGRTKKSSPVVEHVRELNRQAAEAGVARLPVQEEVPMQQPFYGFEYQGDWNRRTKQGELEQYEPRGLASFPPPDPNRDPHDDDDSSDDEREYEDVMIALKGACQLLYEKNGNSVQLLLAMALGLQQEDERYCAMVEEEPYKSVKNPRSVQPTKAQLHDEVSRRLLARNKTLKKNVMKKPEYTAWLRANPEHSAPCVNWLLREEMLFHNSLVQGEEEKTDAKAGTQWNTMYPFLRLYLSMCTDRARRALRTKDDPMDRQSMEGRKNDDRPMTFYEVVAEDFNNGKIVFTTESLPELSYVFAQPISLYFHDMPGGAITADDVKSRFSACRANLIHVRNKTSCRLTPRFVHSKQQTYHNPDRLFMLGNRVVMVSDSEM